MTQNERNITYSLSENQTTSQSLCFICILAVYPCSITEIKKSQSACCEMCRCDLPLTPTLC